jgi:type IV secretory pathway TraG/TraD family ATPase VirD4
MPQNDRNTLSRSVKTRPVVMPSEIQNLPDLHAYIKICDFDPTLIHFEYQDYPQINEPNCSEIPPLLTSDEEKPQQKTNNSANPAKPNPEEADYDFDPEESDEYDINPEDSNDFLKF